MTAPTEISKVYPLTPMQEGILFHSLYEQHSQAYFEQLTLTLEGELVPSILEESFNRLIQRHDIFRTLFVWEKVQKPRQIVLKERKATIVFKDIRSFASDRKEAIVKEEMLADRLRGFDLSRDLLVRMTLIQTELQTFKLIWSNHHILIDGWCTMPLIHELFQIYHSLLHGLPLQLKKVYPYSNYIDWLKKQDKEEALAYWEHYIRGVSGQTVIPHQKPIQHGGHYVLEEQLVEMDSEITEQLLNLASRNQVTLNIVIQAIWGILLQRYNNADDVMFGSVISGRPPEIEGIEHMMGLFINTIPVRVQDSANQTFTALIKAMQLSALDSEKYGFVSLADIQSRSDVDHALFQHIIAFQNFNSAEGPAEDKDASPVRIIGSEAFEQTNYDLTIMVAPGDRIRIKISYNGSLYDRAWIEEVGAHWIMAAQQVAANPDVRLQDLEIVPPAERERLLVDFNRTTASYPSTATIVELFEQTVNSHPNQLAVVSGKDSLTYQQLNDRANQLGAELCKRGLPPKAIVGIIADRSLSMMIGVLAILKAGAAYLPIDPDYPAERINFMLQDSGAEMLLHESHLGTELDFQGERVAIDSGRLYEASVPATHLSSPAKPEDLAYVIYTSGSTGTPKGVMVANRSVVNLCHWHNRRFQVTSEDQAAKFAGFGFDASVWEIFPYIIAGATLHMIPDEIRLDPVQLNRHFEEHHITICFLPTQYAEQFMLLPNRSLRVLLTGGERLKHVVPTPYTVVNNYGPTESTVVATSYEVQQPLGTMVTIPIGRPIDNTCVYVLNSDRKLQPQGIPGELYISGDGLALGYLNRPELTEAAFVPHPFKPGERMYRTGDLARWLPNGELEYLGRADEQVKIRGFRVEQGEIIGELLQYPAIQDALIVPRQDQDGNFYLCAYLIMKADAAWNESAIKQHLSKKLPDYMIPEAIVYMKEFPVTANGKVDYRALPEPSGNLPGQAEYRAPSTETERALAAIWKEVLGHKEFGLLDHFFEQGGHSLKAIALSSRVKKQMERSLPVTAIFQNPTLQAMAAYLQQSDNLELSSIVPAAPREWYPASSQQKRMYIVSQLDGASTNYNMPGITLIQGELDQARCIAAFQQLVNRHESLRTSFEWVDGELIQRIHPHLELVVDTGTVNEQELEERLASFIRPFDFSQAPLFRAGLLKLDSQRHVLMLDMHHLISDGASMSIFMREWAELYEGRNLEPLSLQYKDYAVWQQEQIHAGAMKKQEQYWLDVFSGELPVLELPTDAPRPMKQSFIGEVVAFGLNKQLTQRLKELAAATGSTLFMTLLAIYKALLFKYTGQRDLIVGTPVANRPHPDLEPIMGMFVNTLPIRSRIDGDSSFQQFLQEMQQQLIRAYEHQDYPFEELLERLQLERDASRSSLYDTLFVLQNTDALAAKAGALELQPYPLEYKTAKFDLTLQVTEGEDVLYFEWEYSTDLFCKATIIRMHSHLEHLVEQITDGPQRLLKELKLVSEQEAVRMLASFNDTDIVYPQEKTVVELFEEQAERLGEQPAVIYGGQQLSYRELDARCNQLARVLAGKGVGPESIVALRVERSFEMVAAILAILKAGGAYLPIDPEFPAERVEYMLEDSGARVLLSRGPQAAELGFRGEWIDLLEPELYQGDASPLERRPEPGHLAYVIYTSGSTGQPKGVMIEHRNLSHILHALQRAYPLQREDRYALKTNYTFDVSVSELFGWIPGGGALVVLPPGAEKEPEAILSAIEAERITHINFVPSMLQLFVMAGQRLERLNQLKYLFVAGEALPVQLADKLREQADGVRLENIYGPTEGTIYATRYSVTGGERTMPIGKPLDNVRVYIVNEAGQLQPPGVPGELCIAGAGLARGYLNRAELTAEKFAANPFEPGERMYRTGDLARWLADGTIEYLGRMDFQVKIKGYRIELGEIAARLREHDQVRDAVVLAREDEAGQPYLCAYVVAEPGWERKELRRYASGYLPHYMVPSFYVDLEELPLGSSGKIDSRRLPEPDREQAAETDYTAPANEKERLLAEIWQTVLGMKRVGTEDNFFELGGHSLKAALLVARIEQQFQVRITLRDVFHHSTIREMAELLDSKTPVSCQRIAQAPARDSYPVSAAQKRLYIIHQMDSSSINYNMPIILDVNGRLDAERLRYALGQMAARHDSLRTYFTMNEDTLTQSIHPEIDVPIAWKTVAEDEIMDGIQRFIQPFNLNSGPLFRAGVLRVAEDRHILLMDLHHIIADGVSMGIFMNEFIRLYEGETLAPAALQYKDFIQWQMDSRDSGELSRQEEYWMKVCRGPLPVLQLPTDQERPPLQRFEGDSVSFELDKETTAKVMELARKRQVTPFMLLLAVYNVVLAKYSGQEDIIVGTTLAGRPHMDLENIIGLFVNTTILRCYPSADKTFEVLLSEVKEHVLEAFNHQMFGFDTLVEKLDIRRDMSRNPLFDAMFIYQNIEEGEWQTGEATFSAFKHPYKIAKFDLNLQASEANGRLVFECEYSTNLFHRETMERFAAHFVHIIGQIIRSPEQRLSEISTVTPEEEQRLLYGATEEAVRMSGDANMTIHEKFEEQARLRPDDVAVSMNGESFTYQELNQRANQLARRLQERGVTAETVVALLVERSLDMIVSMLAVLKAGGAYLPIDPAYPADRILYTLDNSEARYLIAGQRPAILDRYQGVVLELRHKELFAGTAGNLNTVIQPEQLAYILYTSGTTGRPKGVMVEHRNVMSLLAASTFHFDFQHQDVWTLFHSCCFDFSVWEIYGALLHGSRLVVVPKETAQSPDEFVRLLERERVTILNITPTAYHALCEAEAKGRVSLHFLRYVIFGGEALKPRALLDWHHKYPELQFVNMYGITETTVHVTYKKISAEDMRRNKSNIGQPIPSLRTYIMDPGQRLVSVGVVGELYVGGAGVARGYLFNEPLTAERFISHPYKQGERLYRTGDLARILPNGDMEYYGRIDHQVKIRGYRIELGEIENQLAKHVKITQTVVLDKTDEQGNKYLCAYFVSREALTVTELREFLIQVLPEYMIPAFFIRLDHIPMTSNGKVDRAALPERDASLLPPTHFAQPTTEIEQLLADIWQEVLGAEALGIHTNFYELGGDSIKAVQIAARLNKHQLKLEVKHLFQYPTIAGTAPFVQPLEAEISQELVTGEAPLGPIQRWFFERNFTSLHHWNQAMMLSQPQGFDAEHLRKVFHRLTEHHDALRIVFTKREGDVVQTYQEMSAEPFSMEIFHFENEPSLADRINEEASRIQASINLEQGPLLRLGLFKTGEGDHLLIVIHHLVVDGVSWRILFEDLAIGYQQSLAGKEIVFQAKTNSYRDWTNKLLEYAQSHKIMKQLPYWKQVEEADIPALPKDFAVQSNRWSDCGAVTVQLSAEETEALLKKAHRAYNTEMNDLLLAALGYSVKEWGGANQVLIELEGHGREELFRDLNVSRTVGWFTSLYPVVLNMEHSKDLSFQIKTIKEMLRNVPEKGTGYHILKYAAPAERKEQLRFNLCPEISFNYLGQFDQDMATAVFGPSSMPSGASFSPDSDRSYALEVTGMVENGQLILQLMYNQQQYELKTMTALAESYKKHLLLILEHCLEQEQSASTPSDFSAANLSMGDLENVFAALGQKLT
ncbi:non-ribosomal peptide synthetase [Paenibacillus ihumii]|uniref:non-ribosomal peptide synthetase n=1 Tax=Paenibacillus ihumii TaxID=687436 RepID=UPI0006D7D8AA|nr:non-ribosomal peptide synthetase [Paenibacillus ihumii]